MVEGELSLREHAVPFVNREVFVGAAQHCDKVIFSSPDPAFCPVCSVIVSRHILWEDVGLAEGSD